MTRLAPEAVAFWAGTAGFVGTPLAEAVAVALAATGGEDAYHWHVGGPGSPDYRGLWAIDVGTIHQFERVDMFDPRWCAWVARQLYDYAHHQWVWHPAWRNGRAAALMARATEAAANPSLQAPAPAVDSLAWLSPLAGAGTLSMFPSLEG